MKLPLALNDVAAVAFDLDGTLIDTLPDLAAAGNRMLRALGRDPVPQARVREFIGDGIAVLTRRLLSGQRDTLADVAESEQGLELFKQFYAEELVVRSRPYPGVIAALDMLAQRYSLACITNKAAAFSEPLLRATALWPYFGLVLAGDSLPRRKPDPMPFVHCAAQLGVTPGQLLAVGDSPNDCRAARAAGCPVVCVSYGYSGPGGVRALDCDAIVTDLMEVAQALHNTRS